MTAHRRLGDAIGEGARLAADIGLDRVRQAVEAGIGGESPGHGEGELVIDDRRRGAAGEPHDQHLLVALAIGDDREARHFRAGAGRRRNGNQGQAGLGDGIRHLVVAHAAAIGRQHRHGLGGVDGAAAAQRDEAVERAGPQRRDPGLDHLGGGIWHGVREDLPGDAGGIEPVRDLRQQARTFHEAVCDDERPARAERGQRRRYLGNGAAADIEQPRHGDGGDHGPSPAAGSCATGFSTKPARPLDGGGAGSWPAPDHRPPRRAAP